jgi:hypothetical protein
LRERRACMNDNKRIRVSYARYKGDLINRFWNYKASAFREREELFEPGHEPPVFNSWEYNVLSSRLLGESYRAKLYDLMPKGKPHKWMRSMTSSQALALSVFGNLQTLNKTECLSELKGADGLPLFIRSKEHLSKIELEKEIDYLGEPRKTSIDVFFGGSYQIPVECKLSEPEIGPCSRPRLQPSASNYKRDYCTGQYVKQGDRTERCALSERRIRYWKLIPHFFYKQQWAPDEDHELCPLKDTYQLVRNILAASVRGRNGDNSDVEVERVEGHCVLLYDERNPEFGIGGKARAAYDAVRSSLRNPFQLQECTWQRVVNAMASDRDLGWLVEGLSEKYGLEAKTS